MANGFPQSDISNSKLGVSRARLWRPDKFGSSSLHDRNRPSPTASCGSYDNAGYMPEASPHLFVSNSSRKSDDSDNCGPTSPTSSELFQRGKATYGVVGNGSKPQSQQRSQDEAESRPGKKRGLTHQERLEIQNHSISTDGSDEMNTECYRMTHPEDIVDQLRIGLPTEPTLSHKHSETRHPHLSVSNRSSSNGGSTSTGEIQIDHQTDQSPAPCVSRIQPTLEGSPLGSHPSRLHGAIQSKQASDDPSSRRGPIQTHASKTEQFQPQYSERSSQTQDTVHPCGLHNTSDSTQLCNEQTGQFHVTETGNHDPSRSRSAHRDPNQGRFVRTNQSQGDEDSGSVLSVRPKMNAARCSCGNRICLFAILLILLSAGIAGPITWFELLRKTGQPDKINYIADVIMKVDDNFHSNMQDTASVEFQQFRDKYCYNVKHSVKEQLPISTCEVTNLRSGSVIVHAVLRFATDQNVTEGDLLQVLTAKKSLGSMKFFPDDIRIVMATENTATDEDFSDVEFDCSQSNSLYLPLPYTYPNHCGDYQLCVNGKSEPFTCAAGHEFAYVPGGERVVCNVPSETTYCGKKRTDTTTPSATTSTAPLPSHPDTTSDYPSTQAPTTLSTTQSTSTPVNETSALPCPEQDSLDELYTCPANGTAYIPRRNTHPSHCDYYTLCHNGHAFNSSNVRCANGTYFALGPEYCIWEESPNTFCAWLTRCMQDD